MHSTALARTVSKAIHHRVVSEAFPAIFIYLLQFIQACANFAHLRVVQWFKVGPILDYRQR